MSRPMIPFNVPYVTPAALDRIREVMQSGKLSGDGAICKSVEARLERLAGVSHVLLTTSCTHALEMATMLMRLRPGDEVILPSFTFVSTANAILRAGGVPVFCDIDSATLTIDPEDCAGRITKKTKGIVVVHYAGVSADMDRILALARQHSLTVIEDAAQGVHARYKGKHLGTIGHCGAFSFHDTKNYVSGEGGAFVTNDEGLARAAEIVREKGTNRSNFLRGEVDRYTWVDQGSSYILSDILAAVLGSQLDELEAIQSRRAAIFRMYAEGLRDLANTGQISLPVIPSYASSNYHIFHLLARTETDRNRLIGEMKRRGVQTTFHYVPLHSSPYALSHLGTTGLRLPITEDRSSRLVRLPLYPGLSDDDVRYVIEQLYASLAHG